MDQRWGEVREQCKKIIQFLQISPRKASLRQGDVLVSLPFSPSQVGRVRLSPCEPNKAKGQAEGDLLGSLKQTIMYAYPVAQLVKRHKRQKFHPWVRKIHWRREWLPTPVFLPGESHGQRSLVGYSPRGHKDSDTTERLTLTHT